MSFKEAVTTCLQKYVNFNGRARRSEFWYFWLFSMIVSAVCTVVTRILGGVPVLGLLLSLVTLAISIAVFIPYVAAAVRRLHDTGKSALWLLFIFIPLVGGILLIVFLAGDSQPGENAYGPCPK